MRINIMWFALALIWVDLSFKTNIGLGWYLVLAFFYSLNDFFLQSHCNCKCGRE